MRRTPLVALVALALVAPLTPAASAAGEKSVSGALTQYAVTYTDGTAGEFAVLETSAGATVAVPAEASAGITSGSRVTLRYTGELEPDATVLDLKTPASAADATVDVTRLTVDAAPAVVRESPVASATEASPVESSPVASLSLVKGVRKVRLVHGIFRGQAKDDYSAADQKSDLNGAVNRYWSRSTGGKVTVQSTGSVASGTYRGWDGSCSFTEILQVFRWANTTAGVTRPTGKGRDVYLYTPSVTQECGFAGIAEVADGGTMWVQGNDHWSSRAMTVAHEFGHTLTLSHSNTRTACATTVKADGSSSQCHEGAYGNGYDIMGASTGTQGLAGGAILGKLGAFPTGSLKKLYRATVFTLAPVGGRTGTRFATFRDGGHRYYVEYRGRVGTDSALGVSRSVCPQGADACASLYKLKPGVIITRVDDPGARNYASFLLDAGAGDPSFDPTKDAWFVLPQGRSFTTATGDWRIRVDSVGGTARVRLERLVPYVTGFSPGKASGTALYTSSTSPWISWKRGAPGVTGYTVTVDGKVLATLGPATTRVQLPVSTRVSKVRIIAAYPNNPGADLTRNVVVDTVRPAITGGPTVRLRKGTVGARSVPVTIAWRAQDNAKLRFVAIVAPKAKAGYFAPSVTSRTTAIAPGRTTWSLTAADFAGNTSTTSRMRDIALVSERSAKRRGAWATTTGSSYLAGRALRSATKGASLRHTFTGRSVAWIASMSARSGKAVVYIDGHKVTTVNLHSATTKQRRIVFTKSWSSRARHTMTIVVSGTAGHAWVYSDGIAVVR